MNKDIHYYITISAGIFAMVTLIFAIIAQAFY